MTKELWSCFVKAATGEDLKINLKKSIVEKHRLNMNDSRGHLYDSGVKTSTSVFSLIFELQLVPWKVNIFSLGNFL